MQWLKYKFKFDKVILSETSDPIKLQKINDVGIKIIRVNYEQTWISLIKPEIFKPFFLHYTCFEDDDKFHLYQLLFDK